MQLVAHAQAPAPQAAPANERRQRTMANHDVTLRQYEKVFIVWRNMEAKGGPLPTYDDLIGVLAKDPWLDRTDFERSGEPNGMGIG